MIQMNGKLMCIFLLVLFSVSFAYNYPYWIDNESSSPTADSVWFKVNTTGAEQVIYVYGNCTKPTDNNGSEVFIFFDSFLYDGNINATQLWESNNATIAVSDGRLVFPSIGKQKYYVRTNRTITFGQGITTTVNFEINASTYDAFALKWMNDIADSDWSSGYIQMRTASQPPATEYASNYMPVSHSIGIEGTVATPNLVGVKTYQVSWEMNNSVNATVYNSTGDRVGFFSKGADTNDAFTKKLMFGQTDGTIDASNQLSWWVNSIIVDNHLTLTPTIAYGAITTGSFSDGDGNTCGYRLDVTFTTDSSVDNYSAQLDYSSLGGNENLTLTDYDEPIQGMNWNNPTLELGQWVQSAGNLIGSENLTAVGTNENVTVVCESGDCATITQDFVNGTDITDAEYVVNFTCSNATVGNFSAVFNTSSGNYATPDLITVSCEVLESNVFWEDTALDLGSGEITDGNLTGSTNILIVGGHNNIAVTCVSGNCTEITEDWDDTIDISNATWVANFTCENSSANSLSAIFNVTSEEDILADNITVTCEFTSPACREITASYTLTENASGAHSVSGIPDITSACVIITGDNIEVDCAGYTIMNNGTSTATGILINGSNATISNCYIGNYQYGVEFFYGENSTMQNTTINGSSTGAYLLNTSYNNLTNLTIKSGTYGIVMLNGSEENNLSNSVVASNSNYGIQINTASNNNSIENCSIYSNSATGVYVSTNYNTIRNSTINNNVGGDYGNIWLSGADWNTIDGNHIYGGSLIHVSLRTGSDNNTLKNNVVHDPTYTGFAMFGASYNNLTNNTVYNCPYQAFLLDLGGSHNSIINSTTWMHAEAVQVLYGQNFTLISGNTFQNGSFGVAIGIDSHNSTIAGNTIYNMRNQHNECWTTGDCAMGIMLFGEQSFTTSGGACPGSSDNLIENNTISESANDGIFLSWCSDRNTIRNNTIYDNDRDGIAINSSSNHNTITNNSVYGNAKYGIRTINVSNNTLTNNTIYNNTVSSMYLKISNYTMETSYFLNPYGTYENYTKLSITDTMEAGEEYSVNWSIGTGTQPTNRVSFENKTLNITTVAGTPSIDEITFHWEEAELTEYNESKLELWGYNETGWNSLNSTPDTANNLITIYDSKPSLIYGIFNNTISVPVITIDFPTNTTYNYTEIDINYTVTGSGIDVCWLEYGATNETLTGCANTAKNFTDGSHTITICANNTDEYANCTTQHFSIDSTAPYLLMDTPEDGITLTTSGSDYTFDLTYFAGESDTCWYTINGSAETELAGCANKTLTLAIGEYTIVIYANDTFTNQNSTSHAFTIEYGAPASGGGTSGGRTEPEIEANETLNETVVEYTEIIETEMGLTDIANSFIQWVEDKINEVRRGNYKKMDLGILEDLDNQIKLKPNGMLVAGFLLVLWIAYCPLDEQKRKKHYMEGAILTIILVGFLWRYWGVL